MTGSDCRGNVLFLILIAVALFAALSYAVTSSTRSGGGNASKETAMANAAAIVQYGASLRNSIMRMKISNGCSDGMLNFQNAFYKETGGTLLMPQNSNSPTSGVCDVFSAKGGGNAPFAPPVKALDFSGVADSYTIPPGSALIQVAQVKGVGTDAAAGTETANDLYFRLNWINKETCIAINDLLKNNNPGGNPPTRVWAGAHGEYPNGSLASTAILSTYDGAPAFCDAVIGGYFFYQVLLER